MEDYTEEVMEQENLVECTCQECGQKFTKKVSNPTNVCGVCDLPF